jgi:protein-disulfide isomerase
LASAWLLAACSPPAASLKKTLEENPDILTNAMEKNPAEFMAAFEKAYRASQQAGADEKFKAELTRVEEELKKPADIKVDPARVIGSADAPVTIVEYFDYNCGHCSTAHKNMVELKEKYGDKVKFVFKHLPILAPTSETAAKMVEAAMMEDREKGYKFHSEIFDNQGDFRQGGEKFLKDAAKKAGLDFAKIKKAADGKDVAERLKSDKDEALANEFNGTPGFMVNGAAIRGAYPVDFFVQVIDKILAAK